MNKYTTKYLIEGGEMELRIKQSSTVEKTWGNGIKWKRNILLSTEETNNNQPIIPGTRTKHNVENTPTPPRLHRSSHHDGASYTAATADHTYWPERSGYRRVPHIECFDAEQHTAPNWTTHGVVLWLELGRYGIPDKPWQTKIVRQEQE